MQTFMSALAVPSIKETCHIIDVINRIGFKLHAILLFLFCYLFYREIENSQNTLISA